MRRRRRRVPQKPIRRTTPPTGSHGELPVKARALTSGAAGAAGLAGVLPPTAGEPVTADSEWASSTTTAAAGAAAAVRTLLAPVVGTSDARPLNSWMLTPSATALADLPLLVVVPSATVIVDSSGVPWRMVIVCPGAMDRCVSDAGSPSRGARSTVTSAGSNDAVPAPFTRSKLAVVFEEPTVIVASGVLLRAAIGRILICPPRACDGDVR